MPKVDIFGKDALIDLLASSFLLVLVLKQVSFKFSGPSLMLISSLRVARSLLFISNLYSPQLCKYIDRDHQLLVFPPEHTMVVLRHLEQSPA